MDITEAHKYCNNHRASLEESDNAGCFCCRGTFDPKDIKEWIREEQTALCPLCGINSVLASKDVEFDESFLREMRDRWFWPDEDY